MNEIKTCHRRLCYIFHVGESRTKGSFWFWDQYFVCSNFSKTSALSILTFEKKVFHWRKIKGGGENNEKEKRVTVFESKRKKLCLECRGFHFRKVWINYRIISFILLRTTVGDDKGVDIESKTTIEELVSFHNHIEWEIGYCTIPSLNSHIQNRFSPKREHINMRSLKLQN